MYLNLSRLKAIPDYTFLEDPDNAPYPGCIIGLGCIESSFYYQTAKCITTFDDPDLPALMLYVQYLIQTEVSLRKLRVKSLRLVDISFRVRCGGKFAAKATPTTTGS